MSGRKRGEVEAVLRDAAKAQEALFKRWLDRCDGLLADIDGLLGQGAGQRAVEAGLPLDSGEPAASRSQLGQVRAQLQHLGADMSALEREIQARGDTSHYFTPEYERAVALEAEYRNLLTASVKPLQGRLEAQRQRLQSAQVAWEQKIAHERAAARAALAALQEKLQPEPYDHPLDPGRRLDLETFCNEVLRQGEDWSALQQELNHLRRLVDTGQDAAALALHRTLDAHCDALLERVHAEHQALARMGNTALEVRAALSELGYRVGSELLGDTLAEGLRVHTVNTDHPVHFDVGLQSEDGREHEVGDGTARVALSFNLDGLGADCREQAERLEERLRRQGIGMRITDWGHGGGSDGTPRKREGGKQVPSGSD